MLRYIFQGPGSTSFKRQVLFLVYSFILAIFIKSFLHVTGALGDRLIVFGRKCEGVVLGELFVFFYDIAVVWYLYVVGIRTNTYMKMTAVATFPSFMLILLRAILIYDPGPILVEWSMAVIIIPFVIAFIWREILESERTYLYIFREFFHLSQPMCVTIFTFLIVFVFSISSNYRSIADVENSYGIREQQQLSYQDKRELLDKELTKAYGDITYAPRSGFIPAAEGELWLSNIDGLKMLSRNTYDSLGRDEKLKALQLLVDIEIYSLVGEAGIVELASADVESYKEGAYYKQARLILISNEVLSERDEAISCVIHEAKHAHQNYTLEYLKSLDVLDSQTIQSTNIGSWQYENENYTYGDEGDYMAYYGQDVEEDSRYYAYLWMHKYIEFLDRINSNGTVDINGLDIK